MSEGEKPLAAEGIRKRFLPKLRVPIIKDNTAFQWDKAVRRGKEVAEKNCTEAGPAEKSQSTAEEKQENDKSEFLTETK